MEGTIRHGTDENDVESSPGSSYVSSFTSTSDISSFPSSSDVESLRGNSEPVVTARSQLSEGEVQGELRKVKGHLHDLKVATPRVAQGSGVLDHTPSSDSLHERKGRLSSYFVSTAVRMLTDYIKDLKKSNTSSDEGVQIKIVEYETLRDELDEACKQRQPDSTLLTTQERGKLIQMLHDYQAVLEEQLDQTETQADDSRQVVKLIAIADDSSDSGDVPLYLSEANFLEGAYRETLTATLDLCDRQVREFKGDLLPGVVIFTNLCTYLVETLSSTAETKFERFRTILATPHNMDLDGEKVPSNLRNSVSFCFESLVGLARRFQLVADLLKKCGSQEWYKSALELADVRLASKRKKRWSEFSLAIRNSEWSLDLVELAFHALEKLLTESTYTVKDATFIFSEEKGRMVLQIPGKVLDRQNSVLENSILEVCRELEEKDLTALIHQLDALVESEKRNERFYNLRHSNAYGIAHFLSEKLRGPPPSTGTYVPYSYNFSKIDSSSLKYQEYLDKGSSGMVAIHEWYGLKVAVKSVRGPQVSRIKFEEEAAVLAMAQHPNVVRLIGCGFIEKSSTGAGTAQLVMELMEHDLRTIIDLRMEVVPKGSGPFSPIVAIDLMLQIAQAMLYLYENRILHRDLKAKNVLVNICKPLQIQADSDSANTKLMDRPVSAVLPHTQENYVAKLADFGLAKCKPQSSYVSTLMAGTTGWRAPEVFHVRDTEQFSNDYKWPADVYSFAMTGYEIVTGKLPFENEPNYSLHEKIMAHERPPFDNLKTDIPEAVKDLIKECWATDPQARPPFDYIVKKLWECKVLAILPRFERKIMQDPELSRVSSRKS